MALYPSKAPLLFKDYCNCLSWHFGMFTYRVWRYRVIRVCEEFYYLCLLLALSAGLALPAIAIHVLFELNQKMLMGMIVFELATVAVV